MLTKQDIKSIEKVINKRVDPLEKILRQITSTLHQTTALLTHVVQDVDELKSDMKSVKETVSSHTTTLDSILKNTETSKCLFIGGK